ncbi:hypothetical protein [Methanococcus sp. CF]
MGDKLNDIIIITVFCVLLGSIILVLFTGFGTNIQNNLSFFNLILTSFVALATFMTVKEMQKQRKAQHTPELIVPDIRLCYNLGYWFESAKELDRCLNDEIEEDFFSNDPDKIYGIIENVNAYVKIYNMGTGYAKNIKTSFEIDYNKIIEKFNEEYLKYSKKPIIKLQYNSENDELIIKNAGDTYVRHIYNNDRFFQVILPYSQDKSNLIVPVPRLISEIFFELLDLDFQKMPEIPEINFNLTLKYQDMDNKLDTKRIPLQIVNFSKYTYKNDVIGELTIKMKN